MNDPMDKHPEKMKSQMFLDVSPEKLEAMSSSELSEAMEAALDAMTEETYDPAVIDAYLDALDRKAPMPTHPNAESSYQDFQDKLQEYVEGASKPAKQTRKFRRIARTGIVAALLAVLLASAAQAAGIDVVGTIARWTENVFSFGTVQSGNDSSHYPSVSNQVPADVPEEYQELVTELQKRGIEEYTIPTYIPEGFQADTPELYVDENGYIEFTAAYANGDDMVIFAIFGYKGKHAGLYEKDNSEVRIYTKNDTNHYFFQNREINSVAWTVNELEYSIRTTLPAAELEKIINSMYEE
jgi:hypothetical protein